MKDSKNVLVLGAGMSSSSLIKYLLDHAGEKGWRIILGDISREMAERKIAGHSRGEAVAFDVHDAAQRKELIQRADVVISMLPSRMHYLVANDCVDYSTHMVTASYVSDQIRRLDEKARRNGVLLLNELGVDPGIDHMSAMQVIDRIQEEGGTLTGFESSTGGLVAPDSDDNPWGYKFTWNPRNVVMAGQGGARFLDHGWVKYIPYHQLFSRVEPVEIPEVGSFEIYPNRDSLKYMEIYGLNHVQTMFRGTMRRPGYARAWDVFVQLGMTADNHPVIGADKLTFREFVDAFLPHENGMRVEDKLCHFLNLEREGDVMNKLNWLGIFNDTPIGMPNATPAQILQSLIEPRWKMNQQDRDMIVMQHTFDYEISSQSKRLQSTLVYKGSDPLHTAMSITVGVPVAIATRLLLEDQFDLTGVQRPLSKQVYEPVMGELADYGIRFREEEVAFA